MRQTLYSYTHIFFNGVYVCVCVVKKDTRVSIAAYVFGNQTATKTVLRQFVCIVNVSDAVFRSDPAVSASHSDWEKRPEGWMDERREVLHPIERGFSLVTSLWVCLGLCALMSTVACICSYESVWNLPRRYLRSLCLQLLVGGCTQHTWRDKGQAREKTEEERGELQVTSRIKIMRKSQLMRICVTLPFFATDCGSLVQRGAIVSSLMAARLYSIPPTRAGSSVFTTIDFLSSSIWKNMAHMPGGDTKQN